MREMSLPRYGSPRLPHLSREAVCQRLALGEMLRPAEKRGRRIFSGQRRRYVAHQSPGLAERRQCDRCPSLTTASIGEIRHFNWNNYERKMQE